MPASRQALLERLPANHGPLTELLDELETGQKPDNFEVQLLALSEVTAMRELVLVADAVSLRARRGQANVYELLDSLEHRIRLGGDGLQGGVCAAGIVDGDEAQIPF